MGRLNRNALANMRGILQANIEKGRIPGAIAVVALGGHVEMFDTLGAQDPAAGSPMREDAIFRMYSMTKPLVSLAAVMLMEQGRLQPVDPVSKYLPEFAGQKVAVEEGGEVVRLDAAVREPTVHDLLRHTAGFSYEFLGESAVQKLYTAANVTDRSRTNAQFSKVFGGLPLAYQPGSCWFYSRATDVLGAVVEVASGQPLGEFLKQHIFDPLGMKDTAFNVPEKDWSRMVEPFANDPDTGTPVVMLDYREHAAYESGGGGLFGTAADYIRFLQLMRNRGMVDGVRIVSRKAVEWMTSDHLGGIPALGDMLPAGHGFGLGFAVRTHTGLGPQPGSPGLYYWSGIGGTSFLVDPAEDVFAMLLTQAPNQRIFFRNMFRHLVYAALD
ncbi:serine hydrolase [Caenimonas sp. SL110]|uniref:serine hydrolase domain-containing protein n=1 Tax=Caenimonas sp. SL110 TaxID=1450524 RepID=UPI0006531B3D|nr:serine hydrolase domain-containing protein [Caenimonas sp. SL110]